MSSEWTIEAETVDEKAALALGLAQTPEDHPAKEWAKSHVRDALVTDPDAPAIVERVLDDALEAAGVEDAAGDSEEAAEPDDVEDDDE